MRQTAAVEAAVKWETTKEKTETRQRAGDREVAQTESQTRVQKRLAAS